MKYILITLPIIFISNLLSAQSFGGFTSGSSTYCDNNNSGFISLSGHQGIVLFWESSIDLINWTNLGNPTTAQSYFALGQTTHFRAIVQEASFPQDTSTIATITINPPSVGGTILGGDTYCISSGIQTLNLTNYQGSILYWEFSVDNGLTWTSIANTTNTYDHPNLTNETMFRAIVENVPGCPTDTSTISIVSIATQSNAGNLQGASIGCVNDNNGQIIHSPGNGSILYWLSTTDQINWTVLTNQLSTQNYANLSETTHYSVVVANSPCPPDTSIAITITIVEPEQPTAGNDVTIMQFETVQLNGSGNGTPLWSPSTGLSSTVIFTPAATPYQTTQYILQLTDNNGCKGYDTVTIEVIVPIPDAITPNNDGVNDVFIIDNIENMPQNQLTIFNRNGMIVFKATPYENNWDGRTIQGNDLADGIYFYEFISTPNVEPLTGFVLIKR
jgi:gliding motility-associated-like protein